MAKHIGVLTLNTGMVAGVSRATASQDGHTVAHAETVGGLVAVLKDMGLTGTLKRGDGPLMEHDCRCCTFLGHSHGADHFVCRGSVVSRTGDDGPDFHSMPGRLLMMVVFDPESTVGAGVALWKAKGCP